MASQMPPNRMSAATGLLFVSLFAAGLVFADVAASPPFYEVFPEGSSQEIHAYLGENRLAVRALSLSHFLAAIALVAFSASVRHIVTRREEGPGFLPALAFGGGLVAATALLLSALLFWAVAEPETAGDPTLSRALLVLAYLAGGPAFVAPLAVLVVAMSLLARPTRGLPAWATQTGLAAGAIAIVSTATLVGPARISALDGSLQTTVPAMLVVLAWLVAVNVWMATGWARLSRSASTSAGSR